MMIPTEQYLAPFEAKSDLILQPAPNGGWVVSEGSAHPNIQPSMIGAYSNASEMLDALRSALVGSTP